MTLFQKQAVDGRTRHLKHLKTHSPCVRIEKPKQSLRLSTVFWATAGEGEDHTWNMNHKMQLPLHMQEIFFPMKTAPSQPEKVNCCLICKPPFTLPLNNAHKLGADCPVFCRRTVGKIGVLWKIFYVLDKKKSYWQLRAGAIIRFSASWPRAEFI